MEKKKGGFKKIIIRVLIVFFSFFLIIYITNKILIKVEAKKIKPYGELVKVDGKNMNVLIEGEGDRTIVILPGYGTASPVIDFKPLRKELSKDYRLVVVEPFGYGLSDFINKERTIENITDELHELLETLGINEYILMGHSIFGIYGMEYIDKYEDEVLAFVGLDSSVPIQFDEKGEPNLNLLNAVYKSGIFRPILKLSELSADTEAEKEEIKQINMITNRNLGNKNNNSEGKNFAYNFGVASKLNLPKSMPVAYFLADSSTINFPLWEEWHKDLVKDLDNSLVILYEGDHYIHHTKSKEIKEELDKFLDKAL